MKKIEEVFIIEAVEITNRDNPTLYLYEETYSTYAEAMEAIEKMISNETDINFGYQIQKYFIKKD